MGKRIGKSWVIPTLCDPACVKDEAKRAQGFDQRKAAWVECAELFVSRDQALTLAMGMDVTPWNQHPNVVDRWPDNHIVKVEKRPTLVVAQQVATMTVSVNGNLFDPPCALIEHIDDLFDHVAVCVRTTRRQEASVFDQLERRQWVGYRIEGWAMFDLRCGPGVVNARKQAPQHVDFVVQQFVGGTPSRAGPDCIEDVFDLVHCLAVFEDQRRTHRDLGVAQREQHAVFVQNRFQWPTSRAIELDHHRVCVFEPHVVDPVFESVERHAVAGGFEALGVHGFEHAVGANAKEELRLHHGLVLREFFLQLAFELCVSVAWWFALCG